MKRILIFITLILALIMCVASCDSLPSMNSNSGHIHNFGEWSIIESATCAKDGVKERYCSCGEKESDSIPKLSHTVVIDEAVEPTCTRTGLTEGKHCSVCNEVLVAQTTVNALGHSEETITGKTATCTETGLTDGVKCSTCDETLIEQSEIPAKGHLDIEPKDYICDVCDVELCTDHREETIPAKSPTCTVTGLTIGKKCSVCGDIIVAQEIVGALGHDEENHEAVDPTCTEDGNKAYVTCKRNGCEYTTFEKIDALGHDEEEHEAKAPTCTESGWKEYATCFRCEYTTFAKVDALGHNFIDRVCARCSLIDYSQGLEFTINSGSQSYSVMGIGACTDTDVIIPDTYEGLPVTSIGYEAFKYCTGLTSITIPDSVTSIGNSAFYNCYRLTSITIPDSVTSIGDYAFYSCSSLVYNEYDNAYYLGNTNNPYLVLVKAKKTSINSCMINENTRFIYSSAFYDCRSLTSITIPDSVTSIGYEAFKYCTGLTSVTIGNSVTSIGYEAFSGCYRLTSITIPDSVTSIVSCAFEGCRALIDITVDGDNKNYKSIDGNLYTKNSKTLIQYAIGKTDTSFTIPNSVTSIGNDAFSDCTTLTSVNIPDSVTSIGTSAFYGCSSLLSVTIGNGVTIIGMQAFSYCRSLTSITIPNSVIGIGSYAFSVCKSLTNVTIGNSVTSIGSSAFSYCSSLTSITIPDSVTSIGDSAFKYCYKLVEVINHSSLDITAGSSNYGYIGYYAKEVHTGESKIVNHDGYLLYTYDNVNYLLGYAGDDTELVLPDNYNGENYELYDYAFDNRDDIVSVTISDSVTSIGYDAFYNCDSLTNIIVDENNKYYKSIDGNLYTKDGKILLQYAIGKTDTSFTIPDSVTSIGDRAFEDCSSFTSVTIPDSVTSIGDYAFYFCSSLTDVYYTGSEEDWKLISISSNGNSCLTYVTIHYNYVPEE